MKLLRFIFGCIVMVIAFGCEENPSINKSIDLSKIENVKALKSEAQRLSFSMLNEKEKQLIWDQHFEDVLSQNSLTNAQVQLISELKSLNTENLHSEMTTVSSRIEMEKDWLARAETLFGKDQLRNLAYGLDSKLTTKAYVEISSSAAAKEDITTCSCNTTSMFTCGELATCNGSCLTTTVGCGFMWLWDCNGKCNLTPA